MTKQEYKKRCGELRKMIVQGDSNDTDTFASTYYRHTRYIYNKIAHNIIWKSRAGNGVIGIQYRPTSIYAPVMARVVPNTSVPARVAVSHNMRRHARSIRQRVE